jgi:tetratricopeptide (TPR) repeat protein
VATQSRPEVKPGGIRKWVLIAGAGIGGLLLLGIGGWYWWDAAQSAGRSALIEASRLAQEALSPQATAAQRSAAVQALGDALARYPRHAAAPHAAYVLGNLHYQAKSFEAARAAFQASLKAGAGRSLAQLCRLGIGYTWEGQGEYAAALTAYQELAAGLTPGDFLYEDALLASARAHELLRQRAQALETYQRLLRDLPGSRRAEEVRSRVASLEGPARP